MFLYVFFCLICFIYIWVLDLIKKMEERIDFICFFLRMYNFMKEKFFNVLYIIILMVEINGVWEVECI